jgi:hypothetical protein
MLQVSGPVIVALVVLESTRSSSTAIGAGALRSSDDYGSSVERAARLHPLRQDGRAEKRLVAW